MVSSGLYPQTIQYVDTKNCVTQSQKLYALFIWVSKPMIEQIIILHEIGRTNRLLHKAVMTFKSIILLSTCKSVTVEASDH